MGGNEGKLKEREKLVERGEERRKRNGEHKKNKTHLVKTLIGISPGNVQRGTPIKPHMNVCSSIPKSKSNYGRT